METSLTTYYSLEDVKKKNGVDGSCVFVIKNCVYDATSYLAKHPGGPELLTEQGGKDATKAFKDAGHSLDARELMEKFKIGELIEADRKADIQTNVKTKGLNHTSPSVRWIKCFGFAVFIIILICIACYFYLNR